MCAGAVPAVEMRRDSTSTSCITLNDRVGALLARGEIGSLTCVTGYQGWPYATSLSSSPPQLHSFI